MKKAQFAVEFIMLFVISLFIFLLILGITVLYMDESRTRAEQKKLELFAEGFKQQLELAKSSDQVFETTYKIPSDLDGTLFTLAIDAKNRLIVTHSELKITIIKDIPELTPIPVLVPGTTYTIKKKATGEISIEI
jgi:hypothetical protein